MVAGGKVLTNVDLRLIHELEILRDRVQPEPFTYSEIITQRDVFQAKDLGRTTKIGTFPGGRERSEVNKGSPYKQKLPDHHGDDEDVMLLKFFKKIGHRGLLVLAYVNRWKQTSGLPPVECVRV